MDHTAKSKARVLSIAKPRIDDAWTVLIGACLCIFCGQAAVAYYTFGVFLPEIIADTQWSPQAIAASIGPGAMVAAVLTPMVGALTDKIGVRLVALVGAPSLAIGFLILGLWPSNAGTFTAAMVLLWILMFAGSPVPYAQMLAGWFDRRRGAALGGMFAAGSIGIAFWPPVVAHLIATMGWRYAYCAVGGIAGGVIFLAAIICLRRPPETTDLSADTMRRPGLSVAEALHTTRFWKLSLIFLFLTAVLGGTAVTFPMIFRQNGMDPQTAALSLTVIGIAMFVGRVMLTLLLDRFFSPHLTVAVTLVSMIAFLLMLISDSDNLLLLSSALVGFGLGSEYAVTAYMVSRAFGLRSYGAIYGLITAATAVGAAIGPAVIGWALVTTQNMFAIALSAIAILCSAIALLLSIKRQDLAIGEPPTS